MIQMKDWQIAIRDGGQRVGLTPSVDRFFFLRHGETDSNLKGIVQGWVDIPLNATGEAQAEVAARILRGRGITSIISSPLGRALRTAEAVSAAVNAPIDRVDARLRERCFGDYEQHPSPEGDGGAWARTDRGAEPYADFAARVVSSLNEFLVGDGVPLVVAHGGVRRVLMLTWGIEEPKEAYGNAVPMEFVRRDGEWFALTHAGALASETKSDA